MAGNAPESLPGFPARNKGVNLRDLVFIFYRRKWVILAVALPLILVGGGSLLRQTGTYMATSRVVVELVKVDLPKWNTSGRNIDYDRELSTLVNIATSVPVATLAASALADSIPVIMELDPTLIGLDQPNALRDYWLEGMDVSAVGESNILEFRFVSSHPRISLMAVGALRSAFVQYHDRGNKNPKAIEFYSEQIGIVRSEVDSLMRLRTVILEDSGYASIKDDLRYDSEQLINFEELLFKAEADVRSLSQEYDLMNAALLNDPRDFPMGPGQNANNTLNYWRNLVSKHEDTLNNLLSQHTEDSLPVKRQKEVLDLSLERLRTEEKNYVESLRIQLLAARDKEGAYRQRVSEMTQQKALAPMVFQKVSVVDAELNSLQNLLRDLQGKRGEVRLSQFADERVSSLAVLTEPELVEAFGGGRKIVYLGMVVFFAIALGVVVGLLRENLDHRVYAPKDVEEKLELPVFASVSKVD